MAGDISGVNRSVSYKNGSAGDAGSAGAAESAGAAGAANSRLIPGRRPGAASSVHLSLPI